MRKGKKSFFKRKFVKKAKPQTKIAKSLDRRVKKIEKFAELKNIDYEISQVASTAGNVFYSFPIFAYSAAGSNGRIGNEVTPTSCNIHYNVKLDATNVTGGAVCRMLVLWDKIPSGALPTLYAPTGAILDNSVITEEVLLPYNHDLRDRFKILYDHKFVINSNYATTTTPATGVVAANYSNQLTFSKKIKLGRVVKLKQNQDNADITDVEANSLLICLLSDQAANGPLFTCSVRTYFKDV